MTAIAQTRTAAQSTASRPEEPAEFGLLAACVLWRAQRRLAWLGYVESTPEAFDTPEAERRWQAETETGQAFSAEAAQADAALAQLPDGRFADICQRFGLSTAERDLLLGALAARLDPSLLPLFHQLQGRPWPTEPLIARLFGYGRRAILRPESPLAAWRLLSEGESAPAEPPPLLADPALAFWLQGEPYCDAALAGHLRMVEAMPPLDSWPVAATAAAIRDHLARGNPVTLVVEAMAGNGRRTFAAAVARALGLDALAVESLPPETPWPQTWMLLQRQSLVGLAMPIWRQPTPPWPRIVPLAPVQAVCVEPGETQPEDRRAVTLNVVLPAPTSLERQRLLARLLPESAAWPAAERQRLTARTGVTVGDLARLGRAGVSGAEQAERHLRVSAGLRLGDLAERLETSFEWDDLVLPSVLREALRDFAFEAGSRAAFWERPEARRLFPGGRGLIALFAGPPGTGKTMAAQIIAREIGVEVFRIDLATMMSKYIGETAKNLKQVFARAADMHALLLFDEADALFANRTEVKDSHDRYANTDTNYLLQKLEDFAGIAVLATNRKTNIDTAFLRRIRYVYDFPRPDIEARRALWRHLAPPILGHDAATALAPALDTLAEGLKLSGAQIKSALLAGTFAAQRRGRIPATVDLLKGIERELAKEGRALSLSEQKRLTRHA